MTGNILHSVILLCILAAQYGCSGKYIYLKSQGSTNETSPFSSTEIYGLSELPLGLRDMGVPGVDMDVNLHNDRTVRSYDTNFIVPIPENIPEGIGIEEIGKRPFRIILHLRAEETGFTFNSTGSKLYMKTHTEPLYPSKILFGKEKNMRTYFDCDTAGLITDPVLLFSKQQQAGKTELPMTCLQLQFDIPTPDPSEKFHLKLGEIITPSGESIRPTIYFTPVNVVEIVH